MPTNASISYINKDFASIYPELLDTAKSLTNKWDPAHSNESDPGVVLLKELALTADHLNYNIDKNILEAFLPSATQDRSIRDIVEMNGYIPRYYESATGDVSFTYNFSKDESRESFIIPAFTLVISTEDGSTSYTQVENLVFSPNENASSAKSSCKFMEGSLKTLSINDSSTILLSNLDDNNRVYFPENLIAQNGVFVRYASDQMSLEKGTWRRSNYLLTEPIQSKVYKVDYDSEINLPYIEFPSDISSIINEGLVINYIATSGTAGNVSAGKLNTLVSPALFNDRSLTDKLSISNISSITNGKDIETVDEMRRSFKNIVGTFETLVTRNDYSNAIKLLKDDSGNSVVSNAVVGDRRTEFNYASNVVVYDETGSFVDTISKTTNSIRYDSNLYASVDSITDPEDKHVYFVGSSSNVKSYIYFNSEFIDMNLLNFGTFCSLIETMSPYDLTIHALSQYNSAKYYDKLVAYDESFKPIESTKLIKASLEDLKCINHNYRDLNNDSYVYFKCIEPLNIIISTYSKLTPAEEQILLTKIKESIADNFNPEGLEFGKDLDLVRVKQTIIDCDQNIKDVNISVISKTLSGVTLDNSIKSLMTTSSESISDEDGKKEIVAKNVLAGKTSLYNLDDQFNYEFGQLSVEGLEPVIACNSLKSEFELTVNKADQVATGEKTVRENVIQLSATDEPVKYFLYAPNRDESDGDIGTNLEYELKAGEKPDSLSIVIRSSEGLFIDTYSADEGTYRVKLSNSNLSFSRTSAAPSNPESSGWFEVSDGTLSVIQSFELENLEALPENLSNYELRENEIVQILYPNFYATETYGSFVNYRYEFSGAASDSSRVIRANADVLLNEKQTLRLMYTKNKETKYITLKAGDLVRTSFDLYPTDDYSTASRIETNVGSRLTEAKFKTLSSSQTISKLSAMKTSIEDNISCYWLTNKRVNNEIILFNSDETEIILDSNEFFIYTNNDRSELVVLGSGTKLIRSSNAGKVSYIRRSADTSIDSLLDSNIGDIDWQELQFSSNYKLDIIEMNVISLGEGDKLTLKGWNISTENIKLNNEFRDCTAVVEYTLKDGDSTTLNKYRSNEFKIRTRFDIIASKESPLRLLPSNSISKQEITINNIKISSDNDSIYMQPNIPIALIGGSNIDSSLYADLKFFIYKLFSGDRSMKNNLITANRELRLSKKPEGEVNSYNNDKVYVETIKSGSSITGYKYTATYPFTAYTNSGDYAIRVFTSLPSIKDATIKLINVNGEEVDIKEIGGTSKKHIDLNSSTYYIEPATKLSSGTYIFVISWTIGLDTIRGLNKFNIGQISLLSNVNKYLDVNEQDLLAKINDIISNSDNSFIKYNYLYSPDASSRLELNQFMTFANPDIAWDSNNVINDYCLPYIDLNNSIISFRS